MCLVNRGPAPPNLAELARELIAQFTMTLEHWGYPLQLIRPSPSTQGVDQFAVGVPSYGESLQ